MSKSELDKFKLFFEMVDEDFEIEKMLKLRKKKDAARTNSDR